MNHSTVCSQSTRTDLSLVPSTVTESDMSLKSRSFLHRLNDRVLKMLDQSSKRCNTRRQQTVQSTVRGTRLARHNDECARIVARCTWRLCSSRPAHGTLSFMSVAILAQVVVRLLALFCPEHDVKLLFVVWVLISRSLVLSCSPVEDLVPISLRIHWVQLFVQICGTFRQRR